jgi:hypothetical protein
MIFEKRIDSVPNHPNIGPNRRHFYHAFLSSSLTFPFTGQQGINTNQLFSGQIALGFRYKINIIRPLSLITECGLNRNFFKVDQYPTKSFPDSILHHSQSIRTTGLFSGALIRVRLGQRGDYLGHYVDFGLMAQYSILKKLVTKDEFKSTDPKLYLNQRTTYSGLKYVNSLSYKAIVRLGFDRFSIIASYRLSRLVNSSFAKDLPGLEVGFEISPVRY